MSQSAQHSQLRSHAYDFFHQEYDEDGILVSRHCKLCNEPKSLKASTASMIEHVSRKHKAEYENHMNNRSTQSTKHPSIIVRKRKAQSEISQCMKKQNNNEGLQTVASAFATLSLPISLIENEVFIKMMMTFRHSTISLPSLPTLRQLQMNEAAFMEAKIIDRILLSNQPITIALDTWTNVRHSKVLNILIIHQNIPFFWRSIENYTEATTAQWMLEQLLPILDEMLSKKINIIAIVMDNASVNKKLYEHLHHRYRFLLHIPCASHVLHLCVMKILAIPCLKELIEWMISLLEKFRSNNAYRLQLVRL